jgi:hypothetical protein
MKTKTVCINVLILVVSLFVGQLGHAMKANCEIALNETPAVDPVVGEERDNIEEIFLKDNEPMILFEFAKGGQEFVSIQPDPWMDNSIYKNIVRVLYSTSRSHAILCSHNTSASPKSENEQGVSSGFDFDILQVCTLYYTKDGRPLPTADRMLPPFKIDPDAQQKFVAVDAFIKERVRKEVRKGADKELNLTEAVGDYSDVLQGDAAMFFFNFLNDVPIVNSVVDGVTIETRSIERQDPKSKVVVRKTMRATGEVEYTATISAKFRFGGIFGL